MTHDFTLKNTNVLILISMTVFNKFKNSFLKVSPILRTFTSYSTIGGKNPLHFVTYVLENIFF